MGRVRTHAFFWSHAIRFRLSQPRPLNHEPIKIVGPNPLRVLVTGAGLAAGYGAETSENALDGHLARILAARTGRGIIVQTKSAPVLAARQAIALLGPVGARTFDVVIFAGCFLEAGVAPNGAVGRHIESVIEHCAATGPRHVRVVVTGLPLPRAHTPMDIAAAAATARSNHRLKDATEHHPRAVYVPMPTFESVHEPAPFSSHYYARAATAIVDDGLADIADGQPRRTPHS